jgi:hypothetical protein
MKKSLFAMFMAGCLLASCNNDEPNPNAGTGELETSYIAVSVNSANASTRADADDFEEGNTSEQKVTTAHFFFFDASGNPFNLNSASLVGESDKANYVVKTITDAEDIIISTLYDIGLEGAQIEDKIPLSALEKEQMFVDILPDGPEDDGIAYLSFFVEEKEDGTLEVQGEATDVETVVISFANSDAQKSCTTVTVLNQVIPGGIFLLVQIVQSGVATGRGGSGK